YVEHLVIQHIFDGAARHSQPVHPPVEQNLVWPRIVAAKLPPPTTRAPADTRFLQIPMKEARVQIVEQRIQIEMLALRRGLRGPNPPAAHTADATARSVRPRVGQIRFDKTLRRAAPINPREQQRRSGFQDTERSALQQI